MTLAKKIAVAKNVIRTISPHYKKPIVMSSFGKDSMVLLHLVEQCGPQLPVLFHREPFFPKKYQFADLIIQQRDYNVYDYPPTGVSISKKGKVMEIINWYSVGRKFTYLPTGIKEPKPGEPFLCGYEDLYKKPTVPSHSFPWDLVFVGHKSSDVDVLLGEVPLLVDLKKNENGPDYVYPLRHFTDQDIWDYHTLHNIPINVKRYDPANNFKECEDITFNNDYHPACVRCIDRDNPVMVRCPLIDKEINNISSELSYTEVTRPSYLAPAKTEVVH